MNLNALSKRNALLELAEFGQSIWLDYTRRDLVLSGELRRLIEEDGLRGMTSNPSIFEKAIVGSQNYEEDIRAMTFEGQSPKMIYETLTQRDVQGAADEFRSVYDETDARDGYVSLEVNPHLAHDTKGTILEARRLWRALNRPNVFIKVPATAEGLPVIQQLISEGINVNITLLFGLPRYRQVAAAYIAGIEARAAQGKSVEHVASVASFFVSRIDTLVDPLLEKLIGQGGTEADVAKKVRGQVAIASAKMAYQIYKETFRSERFQKLADRGARVQRLLWASTSTKNPDYSDLKYVESLIGSDTINTVTVETFDAYRDHGEPKARLEQDVEEAGWVLQRLPELGINLDQVTQQLEDEGVEKFNQSFDKLMNALIQKSTKQTKPERNQTMSMPIIDRDLTKQAPHSPRERIAGFAIASRTADKCRASLAGTLGEYHYDCPLDNLLFSFKGINGEQFKAAVRAAKTYEEIGDWLQANGTKRTPAEIKAWSDGVEADSPMKNPEKRAHFIENCSKLGLNPETSTTFDWLEEDDRASFERAGVC